MRTYQHGVYIYATATTISCYNHFSMCSSPADFKPTSFQTGPKQPSVAIPITISSFVKFLKAIQVKSAAINLSSQGYTSPEVMGFEYKILFLYSWYIQNILRGKNG